MSTTSSSLTEREPAAVVGVLVPVVVAVVGLLTAFGVNVTDEQRDALVAVVIAVAVAVPVAAALIRRKVSPSVGIVAQVDPGSGEVVAGQASPLPTGVILEPGATVEEITP